MTGPHLICAFGCDEYRAPYESDGKEQIKIRQAERTDEACARRSGITERETLYFAVLQTVTTYYVDGGMLQLLSRDGKVTADLRKS
jgi:hypothetical protein